MDFKFRISYKNKSDEELMVLMAKGKEKAFDEIYSRYSKRLFLFFYQKLYHDNHKAQDFLQDLFVKIIVKAETFNSRKKFSSWIYTIAYNMCKNEYRNHKQKENKTVRFENENKIEDSDLTDLEYFDNNSFEKSLNIELQKLTEKHSATFILKYQDNLSIKEISEIMECSEGTVKSRLFYATKKLAMRLKKFNPNNP